MKPYISVEGKLTAVMFIALLGCASVAALLSYLQWPVLLVGVVSLLSGLLVGLVLGRLVTQRINRALRALDSGLLNLQDNDFSVSLTLHGQDELQQLGERFNQATDSMRQQRTHIFQRELLLDSVLQNTSLAIMLADAHGKVLYGNVAARHLLANGHLLEQQTLNQLSAADTTLAEMLTEPRDGLFTIERDGEAQIWHLSYRDMRINGQQSQLFQFKPLTQELTAAEIQTWKKVIRVISHELNNSLAPISSMAHSGQKLLEQTADPTLLKKIFTTIAERSAHLNSFLQEYADFARLPQPRLARFRWHELFSTLSSIQPFQLRTNANNIDGWGDSQQLAQVLLNLLKNAVEAGADPKQISIELRYSQHRQWLNIRDNGSGMSDDTLKRALLPFYSTKTEGTGLGLALCREIIDNHGGELAIRNREGGGLEVSFWLPLPDEANSA